jgi:hypothetical protein
MPLVHLNVEVLDKVTRHKDNESVLSNMTIHGTVTHADIEAMNLRETFDSLRREITGVSGWEALEAEQEPPNGHTAFRVIVAGYDSGYYTYLL